MTPAILALLSTAGSALLHTLFSLFTSLLTEPVLKRLLIVGLKKVVNKTQNETDNQILNICLEAWGEKPAEKDLTEPAK